ncbi:MAG: DMT family transporter [Desulfarculaceae bacterium]|nr:DMT family transporter [Desulfarculaceae bacterium]MCF8100012.1 DMT family transporter [Desulfarculaceae bacterium]MCF8124571.1 DMT family transporter [Desulfarculaceae bacterium]
MRLVSVGPATSAFYRMLIGGLVLAIWARLRGKALWGGWVGLGLACLAGILLALDLAFWHRAILLLGPGLSTILANFQVFVVAGVGVLILGERPGWRLGAAIPLAMFGLWLLVGGRWQELGPDYHYGVGLGLLAACAYASYLLSMRWAVRRVGGLDSMANVAVMSLVCAGLLLAEVWRSGESLAVSSAWDWSWLAVYGLACHAGGWVLISLGLKQVAASRAGLVLLLQPTLAFCWDVLFFGRPTSLLEAGGALLAVAAIYLGAGRPSAR